MFKHGFAQARLHTICRSRGIPAAPKMHQRGQDRNSNDRYGNPNQQGQAAQWQRQRFRPNGRQRTIAEQRTALEEQRTDTQDVERRYLVLAGDYDDLKVKYDKLVKPARSAVGKHVVTVGGGNTAMDAARTAKRMGAEEAMIIYRRDRDNMPAHEFEADEAESEGIKINWLRTIREIDSTTFQVEVMEVDENGRPQPTGEIETLEADALVLALGQNVDTSVLKNIPGIEMSWDGVVEVGPNMMTGAEGVFAGGDMVPSDRTVTIATGHGKKAAHHIDAWLNGTTWSKEKKEPTVTFDKLHLNYLTDAQRRQQRSIAPEERTEDFREVTAGLDREEAIYESARCYSCGNCFECDGCYGACPENAIIKLGKGQGYAVRYELCTGCRACFLQCPCHAIEMVKTEVAS